MKNPQAYAVHAVLMLMATAMASHDPDTTKPRRDTIDDLKGDPTGTHDGTYTATGDKSHFYNAAGCKESDKGYEWDTGDRWCHFDKAETHFKVERMAHFHPVRHRYCMFTWTNPSGKKVDKGKTCDAMKDAKILGSREIKQDECVKTYSNNKDVVFDFHTVSRMTQEHCHDWKRERWQQPRPAIQFYSDGSCKSEDYVDDKDVLLSPEIEKCLAQGGRKSLSYQTGGKPWCVRAYLYDESKGSPTGPSGCKGCFIDQRTYKDDKLGCQGLSGDKRVRYEVLEGECPDAKKVKDDPSCDKAIGDFKRETVLPPV